MLMDLSERGIRERQQHHGQVENGVLGDRLPSLGCTPSD